MGKSTSSSSSSSTGIVWFCLLLFSAALVAVVLYRARDSPSKNSASTLRLSGEQVGNLCFETDKLSCAPKHIHLAQRSNVDENGSVNITVSFSLDYDNNKCRGAKPFVSFGGAGSTVTVAEATSPKQFSYSSWESNGIFQSDWIYHVPLDNLKAGLQNYWYRIVVEAPEACSAEAGPSSTQRRASKLRHISSRATLGDSGALRFRTPPLKGQITNLALMGDLGQTENSTKTMMHMWRATKQSAVNPHPVSHVLIAGDLSYSDSDPYRWTSWMEMMEPLSSSILMSVAAGNHEIECNNITNDIFVPYENYFYNPNRIKDAEMVPVTEEYRKTLWRESCSMPSQFQGQYDYGNSFYSYKYGLIYIIVLNSYTNSTEGSPQYQWLERELQKVDRSETPWLLVTFHSPFYTTFVGHVDEIEAVSMKEAMEPLFYKHKVNFVISGHDHAFMRTHPIFRGNVDLTGKSPIYLTLGAGGNREQHSAGYRHEEPEPWVAKRSLDDYGYGNLLLPNATHALFNWVRDGVTKEGIQDHVWVLNHVTSHS